MRTKIGFTGTRETLALAQRARLVRLLMGQTVYGGPAPELHHGDCVGADETAGMIAVGLGFIEIVHPPTIEKYRAFRPGSEIRPARPYLQRNEEIVDECDLLIACPAGPEEESPRSGTWYTIRYALRIGKPVTIVEPSGALSGAAERA